MYGCYKYHNKVGGIGDQNEKLDAEQGTYTGSTDLENSGAVNSRKTARLQEGREIAGPWGYIFQIIFQVKCCASASLKMFRIFVYIPRKRNSSTLAMFLLLLPFFKNFL